MRFLTLTHLSCYVVIWRVKSLVKGLSLSLSLCLRVHEFCVNFSSFSDETNALLVEQSKSFMKIKNYFAYNSFAM